MTAPILTLSELNCATLARQHLLQRTNLAPMAMLTHLVGMQGQVSNAPYIGLWSRLQHFQRSELTTLIEQRQAVKSTTMRSTLHLMTADDYAQFRLALRPKMLSILERFFAQPTANLTFSDFTARVKAFVQQPHTAVELRAVFENIFADLQLTQGYSSDAIRSVIPLIMPAPNGIWNYNGRPTFIDATTYLNRELTPAAASLPSLVLRYLAAFGPASMQDIQTWSGLTRLQATVEQLRPQLLTFRDDQGSELFDLPDAPRPEADTPAPIRFLPIYDNITLSHANRRRIVTDANLKRISVGNGYHPTLLVDGFVGGIWKVEQHKTSATLAINLFQPLTDQQSQELHSEGEQLLRWIADEAEEYKIKLI